MHEELENFERNQVWTLVEPPGDVNVIGTKWVFKNKQGVDGEIVRNKARLIAQGFSQVEGLDFGETFAPVTRLEVIRILLAFAASKGFKLYQMDMKSAFQNGVIHEEVYVRQPLGFENSKYPDRVYKFSKALYGRKHASQALYARLKTFFLKHEYVMGSVDKTLFTQIYVDGIMFGGSSHSLVSSFQEMIKSEFQMSMMGELIFFLGIQVKQTKQGTFICQAKHTKDLMMKFNMAELKPLSTSMSMTTALDPDKNGKVVDQREYRSMIGSLLYLTATWPDIQLVMGLCAHFQASPHSSHQTVDQRIFRYIKYTPEFRIWYSASSSLDLVGFSDADFAGCGIDQKSTSGTCHFLGSSLVCWSSRKQSLVAQSTTEADYVAAAPKSYGLYTP
jgi:hypothetical protein